MYNVVGFFFCERNMHAVLLVVLVFLGNFSKTNLFKNIKLDFLAHLLYLVGIRNALSQLKLHPLISFSSSSFSTWCFILFAYLSVCLFFVYSSICCLSSAQFAIFKCLNCFRAIHSHEKLQYNLFISMP